MKEMTLEIGEPHPMAHNALLYIKVNMSLLDVEALASTALAGNRTAEICLSTYNRLLANKSVSDRYVLGLAWFLKELKNP